MAYREHHYHDHVKFVTVYCVFGYVLNPPEKTLPYSLHPTGGSGTIPLDISAHISPEKNANNVAKMEAVLMK